jgi:Luciferase-like monooxygenase
MNFGLLYEIEPMRPWAETTVADCFWQALEQVKLAEHVGFSHAFVVEHHFLDQFSVCSAPEVWLSAVAQHTSTIRIGHGSRLLPFKYNNPIRSAEMGAVLDIMSNDWTSGPPAPRPSWSCSGSGSIPTRPEPSGTRRST